MPTTTTSRRLAPAARPTFVALILGLGIATACRPAGQPIAAVSTGVAPGRARGPGDLLLWTEVENAGLAGGSALEAIRRLRPGLLQPRNRRTGHGEVLPELYLDRVWYGSLDLLQTIPASLIREVRYLAPSAAAEWLGGTNHPAGVLVIKTRP